MVSEIYPSEFQSNKANTSDTEATFWIAFVHFAGDFPRSTPCGVYINSSNLLEKFRNFRKVLLSL